MNVDALPEGNPVLEMTRGAEIYKSQGLSGTMQVPQPFDGDCFDRDALRERDLDLNRAVQVLNAKFLEGIGNTWGAAIKAAVERGESLPTQKDVDRYIRNYNFSGSRAPTEVSETDLDRQVRSELRILLRDSLRDGAFSQDGEPIFVQTQIDHDKGVVVDDEMPLNDFDLMVEQAFAYEQVQLNGISADFGGDPEFGPDGESLNPAGLREAAVRVAQQTLKTREFRRRSRLRGFQGTSS